MTLFPNSLLKQLVWGCALLWALILGGRAQAGEASVYTLDPNLVYPQKSSTHYYQDFLSCLFQPLNPNGTLPLNLHLGNRSEQLISAMQAATEPRFRNDYIVLLDVERNADLEKQGYLFIPNILPKQTLLILRGDRRTELSSQSSPPKLAAEMLSKSIHFSSLFGSYTWEGLLAGGVEPSFWAYQFSDIEAQLKDGTVDAAIVENILSRYIPPQNFEVRQLEQHFSGLYINERLQSDFSAVKLEVAKHAQKCRPGGLNFGA